MKALSKQIIYFEVIEYFKIHSVFLEQINIIIMKKTNTQQQIRPQIKIKIPQKLKESQFKSTHQYGKIQSIQEIPMVTKKQILLSAFETVRKNKQKQQKIKGNANANFNKSSAKAKEGIGEPKILSAYKIQNNQSLKRVHSVSSFKIKMSGAGFRRGKSVTKAHQKKQVKQIRWVQRQQLNQYFKQGPADKQPQQLDIIKAYYSTRIKQVNNQQQEQNEKLDVFQYYSQRLENKKQNKSPKKSISEFEFYNYATRSLVPNKIAYQIYPKPIHENRSQAILSRQDFEIESIDVQKQVIKFQDYGFGICNDLSKYDLETLEDQTGQQFVNKYQNKLAQCPYYSQSKYQWIDVKIIGYDKQRQKVIVQLPKLQNKQSAYKKVNRLSLKFKQQTFQQYWSKVNMAKQFRFSFIEYKKFTTYINARPEGQNMSQFLLSNSPITVQHQGPTQSKGSHDILLLPIQKIQIIQKQCHDRYYKQFFIYYEMQRNFKPFLQMGFFFRSFQPFKQKVVFQRYNKFQTNLQIIQCQHYCSIQNLAQTLRILIKKIIYQTKISYFHPIVQAAQCVHLQQFTKNCKKLISESLAKFTKQTRQVLISEIIYKLRYSFGAQQRPVMRVAKTNNKNLEKRYFKLCNFIFRDLVNQYVFKQNCQSLIIYFLKFTEQTVSRPNPRIKLQVLVNLQTKQLYCSPDKQQCINKIYQIYEHLRKCVNKIPDLISDLLFEKQKYFNVILQQCIKIELNKVIEYSYEKVNLYICNNKRYLKYLQYIGFTKCSFRDSLMIQKYRSILRNINKDLQQMQNCFLYSSGIFEVSLELCKKQLKQAIGNNKQKIMRQIEKQIIQQNLNMVKQLNQMQQQLKIVPNEEETYLKIKKYVNVDCQNLLQDCKNNFQLCSQLYQLLEQFSYGYRKKQFEKYMQSTTQIINLQNRVIYKKHQLNQIQKMLIQRINNEREQILKGIQDAKQEIQIIVGFKNIINYKDNFTATSKLYYTLEQYSRRLENINYRQQLLQQQLSMFPWLVRLCKKIEPYFNMWNNVYNCNIDCQNWYELPVQQLNYEEVKTKLINTYKKQFVGLSKLFNDIKNVDAMLICDAGIDSIKKMQEKLWIIDSFTKQGLLKKTNMMSNILQQLYVTDPPKNFRNVNINELLNHRVLQNKQFITQTAQKAQRIWNLEKKVNTVVHNTKQLYLEIGVKGGLSHIANHQLQELNMAVREQLQIMDAIKSEEEAKQIIKKINNVCSKLQTFQSTLNTIDIFEGRFFKLHRLFLINEIINDLSEQKKKMNDITKSWNTIMKHFNKDLQLWEAIDSDSHKNRLQNCLKTIYEIQEALKKYLFEKRKIFPRLFFISDDELIQMIAQQKYVIPEEHIKLFFNGVKRFITKQEQILGLQGEMKDSVQWKKGVNKNIIIWDKLKIIHAESINAIRSQYNSSSSLQRSEILIAKIHFTLLKWTSEVQEQMRKSQRNSNSMQKLYNQFYNEEVRIAVKEIPKSKVGLQIQTIHVWMCLGTAKIMLADIIKRMVNHEDIGVTSFEWQKCIRAYMQKDKLMVKVMGMQFPVSHEYVGCSQGDFVHLFASPCQNLHTILTFMRMCYGVNVRGGDVRQTLKAFSLLTLQHYAEQIIGNGSDNLSMVSLANQLLGFYVEPIVGCLVAKQGRPVSMEVLSIIGQCGYEVRRALIEKRHAIVMGVECKIMGTNSVQLQIGAFGKSNTCEVLVFRQCYRDICLKGMPWQYFLASSLAVYLQHTLPQEQQFEEHKDHLISCLSSIVGHPIHGILGSIPLVSRSLLSSCLAHKKIQRNPNHILLLVQQLLLHHQAQAFRNYHTSHFNLLEQSSHHSNNSKEYLLPDQSQQIREFSELLRPETEGQSDQINWLRMIAVVGPRLSGKSELIRSSFKYSQVLDEQYAQSSSLASYMRNKHSSTHKYIVLQSLYWGVRCKEMQEQALEHVHKLPRNVTIVLQCASLEHIGSNAAMRIYSKKYNNNWHKVMRKLIKDHLAQFTHVVEEISRQLGMLFRVVCYRLLGTSAKHHASDYWMWEKDKPQHQLSQPTPNIQNTNSNNNVSTNSNDGNIVKQIWQIEQLLIENVINVVKYAVAFVRSGKTNQNDLQATREMLFLCVLWASKSNIEQFVDMARRREALNKRMSFGGNKLIDVSIGTQQIINIFWSTYADSIKSVFCNKNNHQSTTFGATTHGRVSFSDPYNFCYETEKKVWLEWNLIEESVSHYFSRGYHNFNDIYLPIKETVCTLYLTQTVSRYYDCILVAQDREASTRTILKKIFNNNNVNNNNVNNNNVNNNENNEIKDKGNIKQREQEKWRELKIVEQYSVCSVQSESIGRMVDSIFISRNKLGEYKPYRNGSMTIIIEDMNMLSQYSQRREQQQLIKYLLHLIVYKEEHSSSKLLANARLILSSYRNVLQNSSSHANNLNRIYRSAVPIQVKQVSMESKCTIFNYVLEWLFCNTDNPFSKEVRTMQNLIVHLTCSLPAACHSGDIQTDVARLRTVQGNLHALVGMYGNICRVSPRTIKKQADIIGVWLQQFSSIYPGINWVQYLRAFEEANLNSEITSELFTSQLHIHLDGGHLIMANFSSETYSLYTYAQAEQKLIAQLHSSSNNSNKWVEQLIMYPQFIRQVLRTTKLFMGRQNHMMKSIEPYDGSKTILRCAMMASGQSAAPCFVQFDTKKEYRNNIIKYLGSWFRRRANQIQTNNYCCLVFRIDAQSNIRQYVQLVTDYLAKEESKLLVYGMQSTRGEEEAEEGREASTLLEALGITSCHSSKYDEFAEFCHNWLKIIVHVERRYVKHSLEDTPAIYRYCSIVQVNDPQFKTEGIVNRSLGILYSKLNVQQFIRKEKQQHILAEHDKYLLKHFTVLQETLLSKHIEEKERKAALLKCIKLSIKYFTTQQAKIKQKQLFMREVIKKKNITLQQKKQIEKDLSVLIPQLKKMESNNQLLLQELNAQTLIYEQKKSIYEAHVKIVLEKKHVTDRIEKECQTELDKVMPMLQSAQQSLAKVTRDDINQLRSFPNPPLPAVKVVESLCFVFNEDQLIKEKVGDNGIKFKDYWEYAKKFILNDRLLKRVTQFKPDYIKNLNKNKMNILTVLIRQQYFREEKVFKASSAAGNLSVWMRAVVLTFEVMEIIEPKKRQLANALQDLRAAKEVQNEKRADMDTSQRERLKRQIKYNEHLSKQMELEKRIQQLKGMIKRSQQFINLLQKMQVVWNKEVEKQLPHKIEKAKIDSLLLSINVIYISRLQQRVRKEIRANACKILQIRSVNILQNQLAEHYLQLLLTSKNQKQDEKQEESETEGYKKQSKNNIQIKVQQSNSADLPMQQNRIKAQQQKKQSKQKLKSQGGLNVEKQQGQKQLLELQEQKVKVERGQKVSKFNVVNEYYAQNVVSMFQQLQNSNKSMIILDETQTFVQLIKQYCSMHRQSNQSNINSDINENENSNLVDDGDNNAMKQKQQKGVQIIDCLELGKETDLHDIISQPKKSGTNRRELLVVLNLQHLTQQLQGELVELAKKQISRYRIIILIHNCTMTNKESSLQFGILNRLQQDTKQAMLQSVVCPVSRPATALHTRLQHYRHLQHLRSLFSDLQHRFYNSQNILLDEYNINAWTNNYHLYWELFYLNPIAKNNSSIQKEVIHTLAVSQCWSIYISYIDFVNVVHIKLNQNKQQNIFVLASKVIQTFQKGHQNHIKGNNNIRNSKGKQPPIQNIQMQQEEVLPFTPFTFVELACLSNANIYVITQFVKERKKQRKSTQLSHLSQSQQVLYEPSIQRALDNLVYLTENQKQIVICCQTKFEAYKVYKKMHEFYASFCTRVMETDDEFSPQAYGFRAYFMVIGEQNVMKRRQWRVIKMNNQIKSQNYYKQHLIKQFRDGGRLLTKAERNYSEYLIQENSVFQ